MKTRTQSQARALLLGGVAAVALMSAGAAQAQDERKLAFDIPQQEGAQALNQFAAQAGVQIVFPYATVRGRQAPAVQGDYTRDEALRQLAAALGLEVTAEKEGVISLRDPLAQGQGGSAGGDVEALIVTAQKREENIQDVPIAISAFSQEDLTRSQVAGGPDLMTQVPNFTFTKTNFSSYSIQIRGIGTQAISATTDAAVAVAMNNTPFIRNRFFEQEFYDLERVEVLRGPQGTLYGRNATAGVVNIITAKPKFTYEAKASADVSNYESTRIEGMVNVPLADDMVALRVAGAWTKRNGYVTNEITGNPIDGRDLWSTRVSLRFAPNDSIDANLIWEHFKEDDDRLRSGKQLCKRDVVEQVAGIPIPYIGGGVGAIQGFLSQGCEPSSLYSPDSFQTPNGYSLPYYHPLGPIFLPVVQGLDPYLSTTQSRDLRVIESTVDPHYSAETDTVELQFSIDLPGDLTLTSETGYLSDTLFSTQDYNRFNTAPHAFDTDNFITRAGILDADGAFCDPQIGCANRLVAVDLSTADSHHFSQEFRLASDWDGPFNFSLGANFLRYDTEDKYYVFVNTLTMYSAIAPYSGDDVLPPYVGGVSDNHECLRQGFTLPNPSEAYDVAACQYIDPNPIGSLNDKGHNYFLSKNPYKLISYAVFGEAYYNVTDNLKITAGLRFTVDKKEAPRIPSWILAGGDIGAPGTSSGSAGAGYPVMEVIEQEWNEPTGRLTVDWKPDLSFTDETLLYASFAHGYKAGGANPPPAALVLYATGGKADFSNRFLEGSATHPKTFEPEFINALEIGAKNTFLDGRLTVNTAAFYYDYTGYQISQIVDRSAVNLNFDADIWGLEIEADWRPVENLRLGFKGGYENTRVADGARAIDLMDRTAGHDDWALVRPFPSLPSNCILPVRVLVDNNDRVDIPGQVEGGNISGCELAYVMGLDPITEREYKKDPTAGEPGSEYALSPAAWAGYEGFNPLDESQGHNGGAGFYKQLGGNELPNAPHFTATITADYTLPLPNDWLATFHTDLYYQSEAWTRIFNTEGYDKLKAYSNINVAAIFSNEDAGWTVMAYVKNVLDRDSITGAFLNSDDSGLTTNVFLTEPRLYGVRITKNFTGGPWWTGANPDHPAGEPYPFTVEIGGQVQRHDAPYDSIAPGFVSQFPAEIDPTAAQHNKLDWGDGRDIKLTYRPTGPWSISGGVRFGRTNSSAREIHQDLPGPDVCAFLSYLADKYCDPLSPYFLDGPSNAHNWSDSSSRNREDHTLVDFTVGRDVGMGAFGGGKSSFGFGLRYAHLNSATFATMDGIPDWDLQPGWFKYDTPHHRYRASLTAEREFEGAGPVLSWDASKPLFGSEQTGHLDIDWTVAGGALFGKQKTTVSGFEESGYSTGKYYVSPIDTQPLTRTAPGVAARSDSVTVPVVDLSLGLSYEVQRVKVSAGYRWERYFDAIDGGYDEPDQKDRTIDGPYFKLSVGFGG